jgi:hypothetical protein
MVAPAPSGPRAAAPPLGIIEGFFGRPWSWDERRLVVDTLKDHGHVQYHYAPKADAHLRKRWQDPHPDAEAEAIAAFAGFCRDRGVAFGVGLSPFEAHLDFDAAARKALEAKIRALNDLGVDQLSLLFDDMKGDVPGLADAQLAMVDIAARTSAARRLLVCPSYYSDDPVLDRVFGPRPPDYLAALGRGLDPAIGVWWTGEEVCAREIGRGHLQRVAETLRRKPTLWDNYPVNDGVRMQEHLHLRAFTGRSAANADLVDAHAINPALQARLSLGPAISLAMVYARGEAYAYGAAGLEATTLAHGPEVARRLWADLLSLQDAGRLRMTPERRASLRATYAALAHPAADEVVAWLDGRHDITLEEVQTG